MHEYQLICTLSSYILTTSFDPLSHSSGGIIFAVLGLRGYVLYVLMLCQWTLGGYSSVPLVTCLVLSVSF